MCVCVCMCVRHRWCFAEPAWCLTGSKDKLVLIVLPVVDAAALLDVAALIVHLLLPPRGDLRILTSPESSLLLGSDHHHRRPRRPPQGNACGVGTFVRNHAGMCSASWPLRNGCAGRQGPAAVALHHAGWDDGHRDRTGVCVCSSVCSARDQECIHTGPADGGGRRLEGERVAAHRLEAKGGCSH